MPDPLPNADPDFDLHDFTLDWSDIPREKRQFNFTGPRRAPVINIDDPLHPSASDPLLVLKTFITEEMVNNNIVLFTNMYGDTLINHPLMAEHLSGTLRSVFQLWTPVTKDSLANYGISSIRCRFPSRKITNLSRNCVLKNTYGKVH